LLDKIRLQYIITNLVQNSIKYSPRGGKILIHLKEEIQDLKNGDPQRFKFFQVCVFDEGKRLDKSKIEKLFKPIASN
jgi:signal transduction histidine kinase